MPSASGLQASRAGPRGAVPQRAPECARMDLALQPGEIRV